MFGRWRGPCFPRRKGKEAAAAGDVEAEHLGEVLRSGVRRLQADRAGVQQPLGEIIGQELVAGVPNANEFAGEHGKQD